MPIPALRPVQVIPVWPTTPSASTTRDLAADAAGGLVLEVAYQLGATIT